MRVLGGTRREKIGERNSCLFAFLESWIVSRFTRNRFLLSKDDVIPLKASLFPKLITALNFFIKLLIFHISSRNVLDFKENLMRKDFLDRYER